MHRCVFGANLCCTSFSACPAASNNSEETFDESMTLGGKIKKKIAFLSNQSTKSKQLLRCCCCSLMHHHLSPALDGVLSRSAIWLTHDVLGPHETKTSSE